MIIRIDPHEISTGRLLAVADLLEKYPHLWQQRWWNEYSASIRDTIRMHTCGTYGCLAGWGVAALPEDQAKKINSTDWYEAGASAYGLERQLADVIFSQQHKPPRGPVHLLRLLAAAPEGERTLRRFARQIDLRFANLRGAEFNGLDLSNLNMFGVDLQNADLSNANLSGANLETADLSRANLSNTNFAKAILLYADLREAKMKDTNFTDANMVDARFNYLGAIENGAILDGAMR